AMRLSILPLRRPTRSPLFPYTTLFRSRRPRLGRAGGRQGTRARADDWRQEAAVLRSGGDRQGTGGALWLGCRSMKRRARSAAGRSEEHTSELQSLAYLVCRLLLEKKKQ